MGTQDDKPFTSHRHNNICMYVCADSLSLLMPQSQCLVNVCGDIVHVVYDNAAAHLSPDRSGSTVVYDNAAAHLSPDRSGSTVPNSLSRTPSPRAL